MRGERPIVEQIESAEERLRRLKECYQPDSNELLKEMHTGKYFTINNIYEKEFAVFDKDTGLCINEDVLNCHITIKKEFYIDRVQEKIIEAVIKETSFEDIYSCVFRDEL